MSKSLVLIADDDVAIRTVLEKKLQRSGFANKIYWKWTRVVFMDRKKSGRSRNY